MTNLPRETGDWHLDKKVTVGLIVALMLHAGSVVWWASRTDERVEQHRQRIEKLEISDARLMETQERLIEKLARVEEKIGAQLDTLRRIEDRLGGRTGGPR
jgi:uncharacterized protein HemX